MPPCISQTDKVNGGDTWGPLKAPSLPHRTVYYQSGIEKRALSPDDGAEPSSKDLVEMSKAQQTKRDPGKQSGRLKPRRRRTAVITRAEARRLRMCLAVSGLIRMPGGVDCT